jgi:hypothetical protein
MFFKSTCMALLAIGMALASDYKSLSKQSAEVTEKSSPKQAISHHDDYGKHIFKENEWEEEEVLSEQEIRDMNAWKEKAAKELKTMHERVVREDRVYGNVNKAADPSHYHELAFGWRDSKEQAAVRSRIRSHVSSRAYQDRVDAIIKANTTGILIPAGGSQLITNALVTLKVVRHHLNSSLPIEIMWQSMDEMDSRSWDRIREEFKPIRGVDISSIPHPVPSLHSK